MAKKFIISIATLGFVGYLPAPGTMGTFVALPCVYLFSLVKFPYNFLILTLLHVIGLFVIGKALPAFAQADPKQIVFDEFVGLSIALFGFVYNPAVYSIGFVLFRFFDIFKWCGIKYIEKLPGAYGVLFDDVVAGVFTNVLLRFLMYAF